MYYTNLSIREYEMCSGKEGCVLFLENDNDKKCCPVCKAPRFRPCKISGCPGKYEGISAVCTIVYCLSNNRFHY